MAPLFPKGKIQIIICESVLLGRQLHHHHRPHHLQAMRRALSPNAFPNCQRGGLWMQWCEQLLGRQSKVACSLKGRKNLTGAKMPSFF